MPVATELVCLSPPSCITPSKGGRDSEGLLSRGLLKAPPNWAPCFKALTPFAVHTSARQIYRKCKPHSDTSTAFTLFLQAKASLRAGCQFQISWQSGPPWLSSAWLPDLISGLFPSITLLQCCWLYFISLNTPSSLHILALELTVSYAWTSLTFLDSELLLTIQLVLLQRC